MALYHVHLSYVQKGQQAGGAHGFHQYLSRDGVGEGVQCHRYLERANGQGKDDLIAQGHGHLPAWAQDNPERFWTMADRLERAKGPAFFHLQVTLPREVSPEAREALAQDIRETLVECYPHSWAIHAPMANDGSGLQPHLHIQFSTRREDIEHHLSAEEWFKQAPRGIVKDASWFTKGRLHDVRSAVELLSNAALAREGLALAVSAKTLEAQGLSRDPARYGSAHDTADLTRTMTYRAQLRSIGVLEYEALTRYAGWQDQAHQLLSLDRQYVTDLCRDHVWRYDRSPAREREQSMQRTFDLAMRDRQPTRQRDQTQERRPERTRVRQPTHTVARQLRSLVASLEREDHVAAGAALNIRLYDREHEQDRGRGW